MRSSFLSAVICTLGITVCAAVSAIIPLGHKEGSIAFSRGGGAAEFEAEPPVSEVRHPLSGRRRYNTISYQDKKFNAGDAVPSICISGDNETGFPVRFNRESIIDPPVLKQRRLVAVPERSSGGQKFLCAAFNYSVNESGHVVKIEYLYTQYTDRIGLTFSRDAKKALSQWRYEPGMVDKGRTEFTGLTTVFYHAY